jgi:hypothetical protein
LIINYLGAIPDFSALPHLQRLFLNNNQLTGAIPNFSAPPKLSMVVLVNNHSFCAIPNTDYSELPIVVESFPYSQIK